MGHKKSQGLPQLRQALTKYRCCIDIHDKLTSLPSGGDDGGGYDGFLSFVRLSSANIQRILLNCKEWEDFYCTDSSFLSKALTILETRG